MDVNIEELLSSKRGLSEEEFSENPELSYLVGDYGFNIIRGKIFIADDWYILDQVVLDSRANEILTYHFGQLSKYNINFVDYIKNTKTKTLFNNCALDCSLVADTVVEINTDIVFNNCNDTSTNAKAIHGYIFKRGVYLNNSNINFTDCIFEDDFKCENANFDVDFSQSKFLKNFTFNLLQSHKINFESAQFNANASFEEIQKIESANFCQAEFKKTVKFSSIQFGDGLIDFSKAEFGEAVLFRRCTFGGETKFNDAVFGSIKKIRAAFNNAINFDKANFKDKSRFCRTATLAETTFENKADFSNVVFNNKADFTNAVFKADADFSSATFTDEARFFNTDFKDVATFENTEFKAKADFKTDKSLTFGKDVDFNNTTFHDNAYFNNRVFEDFADFHEADFKKVACFYSVTFKKPVNFSSIIFNGALNFVNAKTDFTYKELKELIETQIKRDKSIDNIKRTNDFRDGFRLMKYNLNNKGNALDASLFHRLELYCKELELEFTLENTKDKNSENDKEIKSADKEEAKPKSKSRIEILLDLITLKLYRNISDHHTNLLRIINFMVLTIAVYGFFLYAYENFILTRLINYSYKWTCLALVLVVFLVLLTIYYQAVKYNAAKHNIAWGNMLIGFIALALMSLLIVSLLDIKYVAYIALFVTSYLLLYFFTLKYKCDWMYLIYYGLLIVILFIKPFLIAPFISIFTSEQAIESKFKEYTVRYNENGLDDMLLDANLTNTKKDNKLDFIVENRKTILDELDDDKALLNDFVEKSFRHAENFVDHNMSNKNIQKKGAPQKSYAKALAALKYDEIMQSTQKSANLLYGFIMLLVVYSLTKTARKNSVVPS